MNLTRDLLHQIADSRLSINERTRLRCQLAKQLEEAGDYEKAREAMGELWKNVGELRKIYGLDDEFAAEVLLRVGTLMGYIGSEKQIEGTQEKAKDLISKVICCLRLWENLCE